MNKETQRWKKWYSENKGQKIKHSQNNGRTHCGKPIFDLEVADHPTCSICLRIKTYGRRNGK